MKADEHTVKLPPTIADLAPGTALPEEDRRTQQEIEKDRDEACRAYDRNSRELEIEEMRPFIPLSAQLAMDAFISEVQKLLMDEHNHSADARVALNTIAEIFETHGMYLETGSIGCAALSLHQRTARDNDEKQADQQPASE